MAQSKKKSQSRSQTSSGTKNDSQQKKDQDRTDQQDQQNDDLVKERDQTYRPTAVAQEGDGPDGLQHPTPAEQAMQEDQQKANEAQEQAKEARAATERDQDADGDSEGSGEAPRQATDHRDYQQAEPKGRVLEPGEPVEFDGTKEGNYVRVNEDVYRKFWPRGARRPSYQLLYRRGTLLSALQVDALNNDDAGPGVV